ncbi:PEP-CTERM sorting domain-containing protein [Bradyrhizobium sp. 170]|uniref:PEP-CTERM sorting domain-containing protein n=1 Tax=Bradyrhizobium sp. 170 TaxID=2782641 RepID=UPI0020002AE3|nr:PEP-CTERM sorting domain-containing protein [Bradyrhizobium sp. 170]UPK07762.1 hypothetical protein IVB05_21010 [Bradyrhizobium sp. 170]
MRINNIIAFAAFLLFVSSNACVAAIININYAGTYTASWSGNYDPFTGILGPPYSGQFGSGSFNLQFVFDTSLALPGNLSSTQVSSFEPFQGVDLFPSVGHGNFSAGGFVSGDYFASHTAGTGSTTQSVGDLALGKGGYYVSPSLYMTAFSPNMPNSIYTSFEVIDGLTGYGSFSYAYGNTFLGGGQVIYDLTPLTLQVQVSGVPEASTWAMLLIGFAGLAFASYRRPPSRPHERSDMRDKPPGISPRASMLSQQIARISTTTCAG